MLSLRSATPPAATAGVPNLHRTSGNPGATTPPTAATGAPILTINGISKRFGALPANDNITIHLYSGEVLALLGENGAGKTTLMSILFGSYVADTGNITVFGKTLPPGNTRAALAAGIGMVQQHFSLADNLTVLDNIIAGSDALLGWRQHQARAIKKINRLAAQCGFDLQLHAPVQRLSVGERQKVEILKVLYRDAKILVLDEPTAVLTPQETDSLFRTVQKLVADGLSVILISHKLKEIMQVSHRVCVLRQGKLTFQTQTAAANAAELAQAMVGRAISPKQKLALTPGPPLLELRNVKVLSALINFTLHQSQILAITGVSGNGQQELSALLNGIVAPQAGEIVWYGERTQVSAAQLAALGVARIPADRRHIGVIEDMSLAENMISNRLNNFCRCGFLDFVAINHYAKQLLAQYDVRYQALAAPVRLLSGGNMQKLILARELSSSPQIIIAHQPTRGLDVGASNEVHRQLLKARERGSGVVLITEDLDELYAVADNVAVMFKGALSDFYATDKIDSARLGLMMSGMAA